MPESALLLLMAHALQVAFASVKFLSPSIHLDSFEQISDEEAAAKRKQRVWGVGAYGIDSALYSCKIVSCFRAPR